VTFVDKSALFAHPNTFAWTEGNMHLDYLSDHHNGDRTASSHLQLKTDEGIQLSISLYMKHSRTSTPPVSTTLVVPILLMGVEVLSNTGTKPGEGMKVKCLDVRMDNR
jgi:hypothetical protein